jgi:CRISPR-associated protein Cas6
MTIVDVSYPLLVSAVPRDHGYLLYAAISRVAPALHEAHWLGIHPLSGRLLDRDSLELGRGGSLRLRLPPERIADVLPLAGANLELAGRTATVGVPTIHPLVPAPSLDARLVVIKLTGTPRRRNDTIGREALDAAALEARYRAEIERQLGEMTIRKPFELCGRQRLAVAGRRIVGFSVRVSDLSADESLRLMESGIGGKRRMGCGLFRPTASKE